MAAHSLRIAVLIKQVPVAEELRLSSDGTLVREGTRKELNPHCRRAVNQACMLAEGGRGSVTVLSMGPPEAEDCLREAVGWGAARGVLVSDPAFAGSDTYATARALHAALMLTGPYDLVLIGRNSIDSDTGQVGPEVAELLGWPFLSAVRALSLDEGLLHVACELDDGRMSASVRTPAVLACAERLCSPAKVDAAGRAEVPAERLRVVRAAEIGPGPWGTAGSLTVVGASRPIESPRERIRLSGPLREQVSAATAHLIRRGAFAPPPVEVATVSVESSQSRLIAVPAEPGRERLTRELLGEAARLGGRVICLDAAGLDDDDLSSWGADAVLDLSARPAAEEVAAAVADWCAAERPWALLVPGTMWGRELAGRLAVRTASGLTGDAVALDIAGDRLVGWKSAFSGGLLVAVTASSDVQLVTVRPGVLPTPSPRPPRRLERRTRFSPEVSRITVHEAGRDEGIDALDRARFVIGVGTGVAPEHYGELEPLRALLQAEIAATRRVSDLGWLPHSRQVGITGRSLSSQLYLAVGMSGTFNHMAGAQRVGTVLAVNSDPHAPVFESADIGIHGDWRQALPLLTAACVQADVGRMVTPHRRTAQRC